MKILLIHQYYLEKNDAGGSRFNEMTKSWTDDGHEITVLAGMMHYNGFEKLSKYKGKFIVKDNYDTNITVLRSHVSEAYNSGFLGRLWAYFSFVFSSIISGLFFTKKDFDVIIVTSPPLFVGITAYILSKLKKIPFTFEVRDLWPESAIDTGVLKNKLIIKLAYWFENFIYKKASLINVLTPAFREKLIKEKGINSEKVIFIPNAADFSLSDKVLKSDFDRQKFRIKHGINSHFVITYVGAHGVANCLDQVLDTAELLEDTNVLFQLIGGGMEKSRLIEEAQKRKIKNVKFVDPVPKNEVFKYIISSDMGTSVLKKVDTFKTIYSNKTFDYMSCKVPILMAIDGVSRQLLEDAEAGSFVEPENPKNFAKVIREYLNDPKRIELEGLNGFNYAKLHFDREVLAKDYTLSLNKLI
ncbi:glycosyltransferase WbuB [Flammeovirga pectinis]|uniref:Glycosyltransferase WbuB n=1 Tax=Flammeovirga pectinis TaxID=2494373 RepID=A0A3Q9FQA8_9BACT|nr:glycosyltransferase family 4 protein [Flammeovirga pectinis]AZQ63564.1 glycosyltransferase WbuB [Flammeovirga pectinis]